MNERLVLRNLKSISGQALDIVVENGRIADITEPGAGRGLREWDGGGAFVSSGWIDMHVHACSELHPYGDEIDEIGVKQGVTTIVDAGSCGSDRIAELADSARNAKTRVFAFLNISRIGLQRVDELSRPEWIDNVSVQESMLKNRSFIVGLKARISRSVVGEMGIEPLRRARELSDETGLPLMVHIGSGPPEIEEVVPLLKRGDIITHYLNGKSNNLFDEEGQPLKVLQEAIARGVHLDVGHGTASFSFKIAEAAKRHGIPPDTISTDIYRGNRLNGPVYILANVLSKFLYLGYSLEDTLAAVTTRAAEWLGKPELGRIGIGEPANLTLFTVEKGPAVLVDSEGEQRIADQLIQVKGAVAHGEFFECEVRA
ncbi:amidohydrolase/deacetylase family metallohydrolase [Paenibacillus sp. GCM10012306]|uniref:amidohydrolase/deacetylase family metallohydrolase n=1 Tax=Paenibacillus sp. GCM10012306 TaxID=3317342 RepID=UPI0036085661